MGFPFMQNTNAFESLRASDFDCYSAYGEIIDNSIQAKATDIRLQFNERMDRSKTTHQIAEVWFADNGHGMDKELLSRCLAFGESSRYNDRSGIGRFGVGMILGAIHECRLVEVYSKKDNKWHYTYLDLDEIKNNTLSEIPDPIVKDPTTNKNFKDFLSFLDKEDSGTFVLWRKYDRYTDKFNIILNETKFWIGRTFRKFIWGQVPNHDTLVIRVNDEIVKAIDPLYYTKEKTGFESEPKAELMTPSFIDWEVSEDAESDKTTSKIEINVSLLPEEYRRKRGSGGDKFAQERYIDRNEGISILRNYREVFFGHIPHARKLSGDEADRNVSRWYGCEISFMPELDTAFEVKNIKRGCVPGKKLRDKIVEQLAPTLRDARQSIRDYWNEMARIQQEEVSEDEDDIGIVTGHTETNTLLKVNKELTKESKQKKTDDDNKRIASIIHEEAATNDEVLQKLINYLQNQGFIVLEKAMPGTVFISFEHGNGIKTMIYNTNSPYYASYKSLLQNIENENELIAKKYKTLIDFIFVGYMMAEASIDPNDEMMGFEFMDEIKSKWATQLNKFFNRVWMD